MRHLIYACAEFAIVLRLLREPFETCDELFYTVHFQR